MKRTVDLFSYGVSPNKLFDYLAADLPVHMKHMSDASERVPFKADQPPANCGLLPYGGAAGVTHACLSHSCQSIP